MNIAQLLREEMARIARREMNPEVIAVRKLVATHRSHIAALKRQIAELKKTVLEQARIAKAKSVAPAAVSDRAPRFVAKAMAAHRRRLGLSGESYGLLVGVGGQSIYNYENLTSTPSAEIRVRIAGIRGLGKREAQARLAALVEKRAAAKTRSKR